MTRTADAQKLADLVRTGDRRAASKLISMLESPESAAVASEAAAALPLPRQTIGLTGPPGAGKSTLLDYAIGLLRSQNARVGVLAVDPSSPFTGGALLGDRIRMSSHRNDSGVFIRSMSSRGASGGLAAAASDSLRVLGACGFDTVFIETIGAGQAETEVVNLADTVCVVQVPGFGDDVQLMKMGMLEIADIFIVNKGDKPEARELKSQLESALQDEEIETCRAFRQLGKAFKKSYAGPRWVPPVILLSALHRQSGEELIDAITKHRTFLDHPELAKALKRERLKHELIWRAARKFQDILDERVTAGGDMSDLVDHCIEGKTSLPAAVAKILKTK